MLGKDLVLRIAIPATLLLYVLPVLAMSLEATGMWYADLNGEMFQAGPVTKAFAILVGQPNGPLGLLQKAMAVLSAGALVGALWSPKDRILDGLLVALLAIALIAALVTWSALMAPNVSLETWQSVSLPALKDTQAFGVIRDQYFTSVITSLISFGAVFTGIKLKGP